MNFSTADINDISIAPTSDQSSTIPTLERSEDNNSVSSTSMWHMWCSLGYTKPRPSIAEQTQKMIACLMNMALILFCILNVATFAWGVIGYTFFAVVGAGCVGAQVDYIVNKRCFTCLVVTGVATVLLGPVIMLEHTTESFVLYQGSWFVPQVLLIEGILKVTSASMHVWLGVILLLNAVIAFIVMLIVESMSSTSTSWSVPVLYVLLPMTFSLVCKTLLLDDKIHPSKHEHNPNNSITVATVVSTEEGIQTDYVCFFTYPTMDQEVQCHSTTSTKTSTSKEEIRITTCHTNSSEELLHLVPMYSGTPPTSTQPLIQVFTSLDHSGMLPRTPSNPPIFEHPFHLTIPSRDGTPPVLTTSEQNNTVPLSGSVSIMSPKRRKYMPVLLSTKIIQPQFERLTTFVVVEPKSFYFEHADDNAKHLIEKYAKYIHRCSQAYDGCMLWTAGLEATVQFPQDGTASSLINTVHSALKFCNNLLELCGKYELIAPTCSVTMGELVGCSVERKSCKCGLKCYSHHGISLAYDRCKVMNRVLFKTGKVLGCDASIASYISSDNTSLLLEDTSPEYKLDFPVYTLHPKSQNSFAVNSEDVFVPKENFIASPRGILTPRGGGGYFGMVSPRAAAAAPVVAPVTRRRSVQRLASMTNSSFDCDSRTHSICSKTSQQQQHQRQKRPSLIETGTVPPNFPMDLLELWLKYDTNRNGWLSAQDTWNFLTRIGIKMTQEKFFYFLEEFDTDGSCTISMQEFADAYHTSLSGLVLMSHVRSLGESINAQGIDASEVFLETWFDVLGRKSMSADASATRQIFQVLGISPREDQVERFMSELTENGDSVDINDILGLFMPELSAQDQERIERMESVSRVAVLSGMQATFETQTQMAERTAHDWAVRYDHWVSIVMLPYILYTVLESTYASGLWFHPDMYESTRARSTVASVISAIPLCWVVAKLWVPREVNGRYLVTLSDIRSHYVGSLEMVVDIVGVIPLEVFATSYGISQEYDPLFRLHKIVYLWYLNIFYVRVTRVWNASLSRIIQTFVWWGLCIHCFACVFLSLCPSEVSSDIITVEGFTLKHAAFMYSQAFNWAIMLMVGLNRGASIPSSDAFLLLSLATVLVGVVALSVIVTMISNALNVRDSSALFADKIEETMMFFEEVGVDLATTDEVIQYYRHMYQTVGTTDPLRNPMQDELPPELEIRIRIAKTALWFADVPVMQPLLEHPASTYEMNRMIRPVVMLPGEYVSRKGHAIFSLYVVSHGTLHLYHKNTIHVLHRGAGVNEYGLLHNVHALHDVRVPPNQYANLFEVSRLDLSTVIGQFPEVVEKMKEQMVSILQRFEENGLLDSGVIRDGNINTFVEMYEANETSRNVHYLVCEKLT